MFAWRIPGTGEPEGLPSMGSHRVGHDCSDLAAVAALLIFCNVVILPLILKKLKCKRLNHLGVNISQE